MIGAGQRLKEERLKRGLTLSEVSKATKIKISFLSAIEKGEYQYLPSSTYAQGFVRNFAKFLGLPEQEILALFRREFNDEGAFRVLPVGLLRKEEFPLKRIKFAETFKIVILVLIGLVFYILFQYRFAFIKPPLNIYSPKENSIVSSQTVVVSGKTDSNAAVFVNNEAALSDSSGNFKKTITVFAGKSLITIKAVNRFGKESTAERHITVRVSS